MLGKTWQCPLLVIFQFIYNFILDFSLLTCAYDAHEMQIIYDALKCPPFWDKEIMSYMET